MILHICLSRDTNGIYKIDISSILPKHYDKRWDAHINELEGVAYQVVMDAAEAGVPIAVLEDLAFYADEWCIKNNILQSKYITMTKEGKEWITTLNMPSTRSRGPVHFIFAHDSALISYLKAYLNKKEVEYDDSQ